MDKLIEDLNWEVTRKFPLQKTLSTLRKIFKRGRKCVLDFEILKNNLTVEYWFRILLNLYTTFSYGYNLTFECTWDDWKQFCEWFGEGAFNTDPVYVYVEPDWDPEYVVIHKGRIVLKIKDKPDLDTLVQHLKQFKQHHLIEVIFEPFYVYNKPLVLEIVQNQYVYDTSVYLKIYHPQTKIQLANVIGKFEEEVVEQLKKIVQKEFLGDSVIYSKPYDEILIKLISACYGYVPNPVVYNNVIIPAEFLQDELKDRLVKAIREFRSG